VWIKVPETYDYTIGSLVITNQGHFFYYFMLIEIDGHVSYDCLVLGKPVNQMLTGLVRIVVR
jgi:hypothetical protein